MSFARTIPAALCALFIVMTAFAGDPAPPRSSTTANHPTGLLELTIQHATSVVEAVTGQSLVPATTAQTSTYNPSSAVTYAVNNYNAHNPKVSPYAPYGTVNLFYDFQLEGQNNCAHFASQCILAGLCGSSDRSTVFKSRLQYVADKTSPSKWYYVTNTDSASAWRGAKAMYDYARTNNSTYKGLHFTLVTEDTSSHTTSRRSLPETLCSAN